MIKRVSTKVAELVNTIPRPIQIHFGSVLFLLLFYFSTRMATGYVHLISLAGLFIGVSITIVLDVKSLWRTRIQKSDTFQLYLFAFGVQRYQSTLWVVYASSSLLDVLGVTYFFANAIVSIIVGFAYLTAVVELVKYFKMIVFDRETPVKSYNSEVSLGLLNLYKHRSLISINIPLSFELDATEDRQTSYSRVRVPVSSNKDITFFTSIPPKNPTEEEQYNSRGSVYQNVFTEQKCCLCDSISNETYIKVAQRTRCNSFLCRLDSAYLCVSCSKKSVLDVARSELVESLNEQDIVIEMI